MCKWGTYSYRSGHPVAVDRLLMKMQLPPVLSCVQVTYKVEDSSPLIPLSSDWWSYAQMSNHCCYIVYTHILPLFPTPSLFMPQILELLYIYFIADANKMNDLLQNCY